MEEYLKQCNDLYSSFENGSLESEHEDLDTFLEEDNNFIEMYDEFIDENINILKMKDEKNKYSEINDKKRKLENENEEAKLKEVEPNFGEFEKVDISNQNNKRKRIKLFELEGIKNSFVLESNIRSISIEKEFKDIMFKTVTSSSRYSKTDFLKEYLKDKENLFKNLEIVKKEKDQEKRNIFKTTTWKKVLYNLSYACKDLNKQHTENLKQLKKLASHCKKEVQIKARKVLKNAEECSIRAKKLNKEMMIYWRRYEKDSTERKKREVKDEVERKKKLSEEEEMKRQEKKLNFLLTQTELYSHFMAKKEVKVEEKEEKNKAEEKEVKNEKRDIENILNKIEDEKEKEIVLKNVENAVKLQNDKIKSYDQDFKKNIELVHSQPELFQGSLKHYQLLGLNWLISLYEQG
jgi:hypothetical protein